LRSFADNTVERFEPEVGKRKTQTLDLSQRSAVPKLSTQNDIDRALAAARRPRHGRRIEYPTGNGLWLLVYHEGPGRWWWRYRPKGTDTDGRRFPQRGVAIGLTSTHALGEARQAAAGLRLRVMKGGDPAPEDRAAAEEHRRAAAQRAQEADLAAAARITCQDRLTAYSAVLEARGRSAKHVREEIKQIRLALTSAHLMDATATDVSVAHVEKILALCPAGSRRLRFGALDRFMRHALRGSEQNAPTGTFDRHERPKMVPRRSRVLSGPEIRLIWDAAGTLRQDTLCALIRFLISVPARESEAAAMRWHDLDLVSRRWDMPTSKNQLPHRFPLNDRATAILEARREAAGGVSPPPDALVFPAPRSDSPFTSWSRLKRTLDKRLGNHIQPWRVHDLRRSAATALGELGFDMNLLDVLLNHRASATRGGVGGAYNHSTRWGDRVTAMAAWDREIGRALGEVSDETTSTVVPFPADARGAA
jgi:integrase